MGSRKLSDFLRFRKRRPGGSFARPASPPSGTLRDVPPHRIVAAQSEIAISRSVRSVHWVDEATVQNWAAGRGDMLVPAFNTKADVDDGVSPTFRWKVKPRYQTCSLAFGFLATCTVNFSLKLTIMGQPPVNYLTRPRGQATPAYFIYDLPTQGTDVIELTLRAEGPEGMSTSAIVECLSVEALPRSALFTNGFELGVDSEIERYRQPITRTSLHDQVGDHVDDLLLACRRTGMVQVARGDSDPWVINSGTYTDLFASDSNLLGRSQFRAQASKPSHWWALVKCSDGTTAGDITVDNQSFGTALDTITIPVGTTGWTWIAEGTGFDHDCEDNTTATGLRLGRFDDHKFKARRTAGAGLISIATISAYEA